MFNGNIKRDATITKIKLSCVFCIRFGGSSILQPEGHVFFLMIYLFSFFACLVILFFDIYIYTVVKSCFFTGIYFCKKAVFCKKAFLFCKEAFLFL